MTVVWNAPSRLCRVVVVLWMVAAARSQSGHGNITLTTTVAELGRPVDNGSSTYDVRLTTSGPITASPISSGENGTDGVSLAEPRTEDTIDPEQNATSGRGVLQNGTRGGTAGNDADLSQGVPTTAKIIQQTFAAILTEATTRRNAVDETWIKNGSDNETTSLMTSQSPEGRNGSAVPRHGFETVSPGLLDENGATEFKDQNGASSSAPVASLPGVNKTDPEMSRGQSPETGNSSAVSGVEAGRSTTVNWLAPNPAPPAAKPNTLPRTTSSPWTGKQNETVTTKPNMKSPHNDSALVKSGGVWKNCSSDCWGIAIGIPVAGVIVIALVLTISLLCIKPRNFSVPKSSGSTELDSLNGSTQYNTGEPPGVTTEVIVPECFTNMAVTV